MYFSTLSKELQQAVRALTADKEFQDLFGHDPVLDKLDEDKCDVKRSFLELQAIITGKVIINGRSYNALTPQDWAFLWILGSPLVSFKEATKTDAELFFYVIDHDFDVLDPVKIFELSVGYLDGLGIPEDEALCAAKTIIGISFSALSMMPHAVNVQVKNEHEETFDADWLTSIISTVHDVTGLKPDEVMKLPLCSCSYYYVQAARKNGAKNIERLPSEEILKLQDERTCRLITDYFIKKGVIKEEDGDDFFKQISTPLDNK